MGYLWDIVHCKKYYYCISMREANGRDVGIDEEEEKKKKKDEAGLEKGRHTLRRERE